MRILLLCGVLIASPVAAQSSAPTAVQPGGAAPMVAIVKADAEPEKLICRKQVVIGSLIAKKRVCATARNWERNEALAKEHLDILTAPGAFAPSR